MEFTITSRVYARWLILLAMTFASLVAGRAQADDVTITGNDLYLTESDQGTITFTLNNALSTPIYTYGAELFDFEQVFGDFSGGYAMTSQAGDCPQTVAADSSCTLASYTFTTSTIPTVSTDICQCAEYQLIYIVNWINPPTGKPRLNGPTEIKSDVFEYIDSPAASPTGVSEPAGLELLGIGLLVLVAVKAEGFFRAIRRSSVQSMV
jgi:hypothetical protein